MIIFFLRNTNEIFLKEKGILAVVKLRKDRMKGSQNNLLSEKELKKRGRGLKLTPASFNMTVIPTEVI